MILEENILKLAATKNEPLKVVYPEDGVVIIPSPDCYFQYYQKTRMVLKPWLTGGFPKKASRLLLKAGCTPYAATYSLLKALRN